MIVASSPQQRQLENRHEENQEIEKTKIRNDLPLTITSSSIPQFFFPNGKPVSDDLIRNDIVRGLANFCENIELRANILEYD